MTWFWARDQGLLVGLFTRDDKYLCEVVMICSTLVNIQTYTHTHTQATF